MQNNRVTMFLIFTLSLITLGCSQRGTPINFCERFEADQSNLNDSELRKVDFQINWDIVQSLLDSGNIGKIEKDSCYYKFMRITLIHNAQIFPSNLFNEKTIRQINQGLEDGLFSRENLILALTFYKDFTSEDMRCERMKPMVDKAIKSWKINENIIEGGNFDKIENINYVACD